MTATPVDMEQMIRDTSEIVHRSLHHDCWHAPSLEFTGDPCLKCELLHALGEDE